jgi:DNA-binding NtrC family response regulator
MSAGDKVVSISRRDEIGDEVSGQQRAKHQVFVDPASRSILSVLDRVAPSDAAVLIAGETGTGKELTARYIHRKSQRTGPFLAVNCGAISEHLAESELFGHEAGSFTGANTRREGWFEAANGGTLFLDEIGDLPLNLQGKLLRVLQEGEVTRIGSRRTIAVDVRVVSASNVDLQAAVAQGRFRRDLLYRLNIVPVELPPLRDRPGDIDALARHFAGVYAAKLQRSTPHIHAAALEALKRHTWPGNIRELENVVHYALLMSSDDQIRVEHLRIPAASTTTHGSAAAPRNRIGALLRELFKAPGASLLRDVEKQLVEESFRFCDSNQVRTAELLGVSRNVIRTLLKRYGLIAEVGADDDDLGRHAPLGRMDKYACAPSP